MADGTRSIYAELVCSDKCGTGYAGAWGLRRRGAMLRRRGSGGFGEAAHASLRERRCAATGDGRLGRSGSLKTRATQGPGGVDDGVRSRGAGHGGARGAQILERAAQRLADGVLNTRVGVYVLGLNE